MTLATGGKDLIRQVQKALGERSREAELVPLLYGNGLDGLEAVPPASLAENVRAALKFIAEKPKGSHKISVRSVRAGSGQAEGTLVEILNDDMPFLVDSVTGELQARGLEVRSLLHPIFKTRRDTAGRLKALLGPGDQNWNDGRQESYIAIRLRPLPERARGDLAEALSGILDEVRAAVSDWQPMLQQVRAAIAEVEAAPRSVAAGQRQESVAFLRWLEAGNFTFLGVRAYRLDGTPETGTLVPAEKAGLGVLRNPAMHVLRRGIQLVDLTPEVRRFYFAPAPLIITKANVVSRVHRRAHMDYVGVKTYRRDGTVAGEIRIVGLFTSQAYTGSPREIPFLRHKVETVVKMAGHPPSSHAGKALLNVLETFPRDELFQIDVDQLKEWCDGILDLETRPRVRVFVRIDRFDRFVSVLVYAPRDRYNSTARERIGALLADAYKGRVVAFYPYFADGPLVRVQFIIGRYEGATPQVQVADLERGIAEIARTWEDRLAEALGALGARAQALIARYGAAFSAGYAETFSAERALHDIERIERLGAQMPVAIDFYHEAGAPAGRLRAAIYRFGGPISLSERVPVLENLGFRAIDERSYQVHPRFPEGPRPVTLHDMVLETADGAPLDLGADDKRLEACVLAVFRGEADNDSFNRLVVSAGADWRSVAALRAWAAFLRQLGSPFGPRYIADTLNRHAGVSRALLELIHLRFDPGRNLAAAERKAAEEPIRGRIEGALAVVPSLDEDRILRQLLNLIGAMVRTNFFQERFADSPPRRAEGAPPSSGEGLGVGGTPTSDVLGSPPPCPSPTFSGRASGATGEGTMWPAPHPPATIAFKFDSKAVEAAPQPRPFREIWVYSPRVEGVHLRFAPIARGGIRWSDRAQDFRTEVLG